MDRSQLELEGGTLVARDVTRQKVSDDQQIKAQRSLNITSAALDCYCANCHGWCDDTPPVR